MKKQGSDCSRLRPLLVLLLCSVAVPPLALWGHVDQGPAAGRSDGLPLTPTRTIEFTTDEGTWMSVDVSPDGKTLVFDLLGDLYSLPIDGGKATRITEGPAFDAQPRFSPDGKTIVFTSDRSGSENLWLADRDGTNARALTRDENCRYTSPEWTPEGADIVASQDCSAITRFGKRDLFLFHTSGAPATKLTPAPFDHYLGAAFGPDSRYLYVAGKRGGFAYFQPLPIWQIGVLDRVTEKLTVLTTADGSAMRPVLSPDGKKMVFATRVDMQTALKLRDLTTGDETWLAVGMPRDDQESRSNLDTMPGSAFTPDGTQLVTSFGGRLWRMDVPSGRVAPIPFTAEVKQHLGPLPHFDATIGDSLTVQHIYDGRLSPDGRQFAFTALDKVWVMDLPSGKPRRLTSAETSVGEFEPAWSPDGRFIAYVTWTPKGGDVYRVAASGQTPPERLTTQTAAYRRFVYTPDGTMLVGLRGSLQARLTRGADSNVEMVSMAAGGGPVEALKNTSVESPQFTRDGRLYVAARRDGLVSMRLDGTDRTPHMKVTGALWVGGAPEDATASQIVVSPDGARALAYVNSSLYLLQVPKAAEPVATVSVATPAAGSVQVMRITRSGAESPAWRADGLAFSYSLGRSVFIYDLASGLAERQAGPTGQRQEYEPRRVDIQIVVPRDKPAGSVVLRGARIITMKGNQIIEQGDLVVTHNRIAAVGARGTVAIPKDARVIDVTGKTIIPGWVDIHAHLDPPTGLHVTQSWEYLVTLAYGVTTVRIPNTHGPDAFSYADRVEMGEIMGPRIHSTGLAIGPPSWAGRSSLDDARDILRPYAEFWNTRMIKQYATGDRKLRQWMNMAALEFRLMGTVEGNIDPKTFITDILDGYPGHEHSYPIVPMYKDVVQLTARSGTTYDPTLIVNYGGPIAEEYFYVHEDVHANEKLRRFTPHPILDRKGLRRDVWYRDSQYIFAQQAESVAKIVAAGGRAAMGAHGQLQGLGAHWEIWMLESGGMPRHDVLRVGTIFGADAIGLGKEIGSLEVGKLADLQVLDRNPLDNIRNTDSLRYVMKNGRLYETETLNEIWPRQKVLDRPWWWDLDPPADKTLPKRKD